MRCLGLLLAITLGMSGCVAPPFGDRAAFWRKDRATYSISDVRANRSKGNISRIVLYWVPANSQHMRADQVKMWEVKPQKPTPFSGFRFRALETPPGFRSTKRPGTLPNSGYYYLEIYGFPESSLLMNDLPSCDSIYKWLRARDADTVQ